MQFTVRRAQIEDLTQLENIGHIFFAESNLCTVTAIHPKWFETLPLLWEVPDEWCTLVVCNRAGLVVGYAHLVRQVGFTIDRIPETYQFCIMPEYRGTGAGRALTIAIDDYVNEYWEAVADYAECGCGFEDGGRNNKLFVNMYKKQGYSELGTALFKIRRTRAESASNGEK